MLVIQQGYLKNDIVNWYNMIVLSEKYHWYKNFLWNDIIILNKNLNRRKIINLMVIFLYRKFIYCSSFPFQFKIPNKKNLLKYEINWTGMSWIKAFTYFNAILFIILNKQYDKFFQSPYQLINFDLVFYFEKEQSAGNSGWQLTPKV